MSFWGIVSTEDSGNQNFSLGHGSFEGPMKHEWRFRIHTMCGILFRTSEEKFELETDSWNNHYIDGNEVTKVVKTNKNMWKEKKMGTGVEPLGLL